MRMHVGKLIEYLVGIFALLQLIVGRGTSLLLSTHRCFLSLELHHSLSILLPHELFIWPLRGGSALVVIAGWGPAVVALILGLVHTLLILIVEVGALALHEFIAFGSVLALLLELPPLLAEFPCASTGLPVFLDVLLSRYIMHLFLLHVGTLINFSKIALLSLLHLLPGVSA